MFFTALKRISAVKKVEMLGANLFLTVPSTFSSKSLRELLGLFFRYKIDMKQLAQFRTKKNSSWFHDPGRYWFRKVFPRR